MADEPADEEVVGDDQLVPGFVAGDWAGELVQGLVGQCGALLRFLGGDLGEEAEQGVGGIWW